jgi:hypothetical protein
MLIQKYSANPVGSNIELIGYITECRKSIGNGCYCGEIEYIMSVTEYSMPNSIHRGTFIVSKESIKAIHSQSCLDMFELLTDIYNDMEAFSDLSLNGYADRIEKLINE